MVDHMLNTCKALDFIPSTAKYKNKTHIHKQTKKKTHIKTLANLPVHQADIIKVDTIKNKQADISILEGSFL